MKLISWLKAIWDMPWYMPFGILFIYYWIRWDIGLALFITVGLFIISFIIGGLVVLAMAIIEYIRKRRGAKE